MESVHLQLPADLLARVDEARKTPLGTVARNAWIRDAIELYARRAEHAAALAGETHEKYLARILSEPGHSIALRATYTADQLDDLAARRVSEISPARSTAQVKRGVQPRPKGGKK